MTEEMERRWAQVILLLAEHVDNTDGGGEVICRTAVMEVLREAHETSPDTLTPHTLWWMGVISDEEHLRRCGCR